MDTKKTWGEVLDTVRVSVSPANFSTWFSQTFIVSSKNLGRGRRVVEVGCPSSYIAGTLEERYYGILQDSLNRATGAKNDITFVIKSLPSQDVKKILDHPLFSQQTNGPIKNVDDVLRKARVQSGFTFENFAVSSTNQMAHAAADAVSRNLGSAYNPLFLWGRVGVGKTHLMLAIAQIILSKEPSSKVRYCMGEEFTTEIVEAIRTKTTQEFKNRYRKLDLLMLDDVQFLAGKTAAQEEFFHTFNTLLREGGQVVLTSDRPPQEIQKLEDRLSDRFEAGLIIDISPPDFELRVAISLIKARERGFNLPMDIAQAIGANIENPRKIEGFITRILTEVGESKEKVTLDLVTNLLGKANGNGEAKKIFLPQDFIGAVANYFSLGKRKLLGNNRSRPVAQPRQILMYLLRIELGLTLEEVGRLTGGRDHTTVMHAVEKISKNLSTDDNLRRDILGIKNTVSG